MKTHLFACFVFVLFNGSVAMAGDDIGFKHLPSSSSARNVCIAYIEAENNNDWITCHSFLHQSLVALCPKPSELQQYAHELPVYPDGEVKATPMSFSFGGGPEITFVKLSSSMKGSPHYVSVVFILKRNSDGHWGICFAYPSKLVPLFAKGFL